jgi:hypothetical protein
MPAVNRTHTFNDSVYQFNGLTSVQRLKKVVKNRQNTSIAPPYNTAPNFLMRGWDNGLGQWVEWGPFNFAFTTPSAGQTRPNYTGSLSQIHVAALY